MSLKNQWKKLQARVAAPVEKGLRAIPGVNNRIEAQYDELMGDLEETLKPYRDDFYG